MQIDFSNQCSFFISCASKKWWSSLMWRKDWCYLSSHFASNLKVIKRIHRHKNMAASPVCQDQDFNLPWAPLGCDLGPWALGTHTPPAAPWSQGYKAETCSALARGHSLGWFNRLAQSKVCGMWSVVLIANSDLVVRIILLGTLSWVSKEHPDCRWLATSGRTRPSLTAGSQYFTEHLSPTLSTTVDGMRHTWKTPV